MTKENLHGMVILMKSDKTLVKTKKIRIYQREKLVDLCNFLVPFDYEQFNRESEEYPDMSVFTVTLQYLTPDGTVHAEILERKSDGEGGYINYEDANGNEDYMIYVLPINTNLTKQAGDLTIKLNLQYTDYAGEQMSDDDNSEAPEPIAINYVLNTDSDTLTVLPVADYYSIIPDESLSKIDQKIAELEATARELDATASTYDAAKADNIVLDEDEGTLYLSSNGVQVGDKIDLDTLGDGVSQWTEEGLVTVVL